MDLQTAYFCVIVVLFQWFMIGNCLTTYSDLVKLNASCAPFDTCSIARTEDSLFHYRCECNPSCSDTGTCCIDSPNRLTDPSPMISDQQSTGYCHMDRCEKIGVFVTNKCKPSWTGSSIVKNMCERPSNDMSDPVSVTPVTNTKNGMSYQNYFCAVCNGDSKSLEFWNIKISKIGSRADEKSETSEVMEGLVYDESRKEWGLPQKGENGSIVFTPVSINFELPSQSKILARTCVRNVQSTCHHSWTDESIRKKCSEYMALVYLNPLRYLLPPSYHHSSSRLSSSRYSRTYRNIHCLICNFQNYSDTTICDEKSIRRRCHYSSNERPLIAGGHTTTKRPMPISILLNIKFSYDNGVGEINACKQNQMYDAFYKNCRTLVCGLPGYIMVDGKCLPP